MIIGRESTVMLISGGATIGVGALHAMIGACIKKQSTDSKYPLSVTVLSDQIETPTYQLQMRGSETIADIKGKLAEAAGGMATAYQNFFISDGGKIFEDHQTLEECGITSSHLLTANISREQIGKK